MNLRCCSRGFSLAETVIAVGIGAVVMGAVASMLGWASTVQSSSLSRVHLEVFRNDLLMNLKSEAFATKTVPGTLNSSAMKCLVDGTPCTENGSPNGTPITDRPFALYNMDGTVYYDGIHSAGLYNGASQCAAPTTESSGGQPPPAPCDYLFGLTWSAMCQTGNCVNPQIRVSMKFSTPTGANPLNSALYTQNVYLNAFAPPSTAPVCGAIAHVQNANTFTVNWAAGTGNGGPGGCSIEYRRPSGSWTRVATVDCDADGASAGTITLPGGSWLGGGNWNAPIDVRLVKNSDGAVLCPLGSLMCASRQGSTTATPGIDENCNGGWDDVQAMACAPNYHIAMPRTVGANYSCSDTYDDGYCSYTFLKAGWMTFAYFHYETVTTYSWTGSGWTGGYTFVPDTTCSPASSSFYSNSYVVDAETTAKTGVVPPEGHLRNYPTEIYDVTPTACAHGPPTNCVCITNCGYPSERISCTYRPHPYKVSTPGTWTVGECIYDSAVAHGTGTLYY